MIKTKIKNKFNIDSKGIGLIEVIVALGISTVIITSLIALSIFTLRSSLKGKLFFEASNATSKQLELVRAYRDSNSWNFFIETIKNCVANGPVCYVSLSDDGSIRIQDGPVPSIQEMEIDQVSVGFYVLEESEFNTIKVVSVAQYFDGPEIKRTTLRADFTNWQSK